MASRARAKGKLDRRKGKGKGKEGKCGGDGQWQGKGNSSSTGCTWCGDLNHWRADCEKLKKHKSDMDADRKKRGLPAFVPQPRGVNSLDPEDRNLDRQNVDDDSGDYEVTGLTCESDDGDGNFDMLEIDLREITFCFSGRDPTAYGTSEQFCDCDCMCGVL